MTPSSTKRRCYCCCCYMLVIVFLLNGRDGLSFLVDRHPRPRITPTVMGHNGVVGVPVGRQPRINRMMMILQSTTEDEQEQDFLSFDQAGAGIMDEDNKKRLEDLKNSYMDDENPDGGASQYEALRAALRSRTENLGLEKSQVTADYIARRTAEAQSAGSAAAAGESNDTFAGLDLSKIRQSQTPNAAADENLPSMFYEVDELISDEDKAIADPVGQLPIIEQALNELRATKWPTPMAALREVVVVIIMIGLTGGLIVGWDYLLRILYTDVLHFIPSPEEMAEYTNRFDGLDLPPGWTDNMNEDDIAQFTDLVTGTAPMDK